MDLIKPNRILKISIGKVKWPDYAISIKNILIGTPMTLLPSLQAVELAILRFQ